MTELNNEKPNPLQQTSPIEQKNLMSIEYDLMDNILDRIVQVRRNLNHQDYIDAGFDLGIIHYIISEQISIYEASVEESE